MFKKLALLSAVAMFTVAAHAGNIKNNSSQEQNAQVTDQTGQQSWLKIPAGTSAQLPNDAASVQLGSSKSQKVSPSSNFTINSEGQLESASAAGSAKPQGSQGDQPASRGAQPQDQQR